MITELVKGKQERVGPTDLDTCRLGGEGEGGGEEAKKTHHGAHRHSSPLHSSLLSFAVTESKKSRKRNECFEKRERASR